MRAISVLDYGEFSHPVIAEFNFGTSTVCSAT